MKRIKLELIGLAKLIGVILCLPIIPLAFVFGIVGRLFFKKTLDKSLEKLDETIDNLQAKREQNR